jgi:hypothetical protein
VQGNLSIRKVRTASGAVAVQVIRYAQGKRIIVRHIGSSHTDEELALLYQEAESVRERLSHQQSLFSVAENHPNFCMRTIYNCPQLRIYLPIRP